MRRLLFFCMSAALALTPTLGLAQTRSIFSNLSNPSIGMNALFSGQVAPDLDEPYNIHFDEAEISVISVVDPYWTFWSNIVFGGDGEVDPEEIVARTDRIPSVELRVGKLRGDFGKHGLLHTHAFPFVQAPVIMANTIGEEGFKDAGLEASWLTPLPWYSELTGGVFQAVAPDDEHPLDLGSARHDNIPYLGHLKNVFDVNESTTMELGGSLLQGWGSDAHRHAAYGADLTFRNVPLRKSNSRGWILQGEYIEKGSYKESDFMKEQNGWYASFQYRLSQVWWAGIRGEQARDSHIDVLGEDDAGDPILGKVTRASANIAWMPSEFSYVRLEYSFAQADDGHGFKPKDQRLMIEMSYTVGYHPAHAY
jgi:hypothetical protein